MFLLQKTLDFFLPRVCLGCKTILQSTSDNPICFECFNKITWLTPPRCKTCCIKFSEDLLQDHQCLHCISQKWHFEQIIACTQYDDISSKIAMKLKYQAVGAKYIAQNILKTNFDLIKKIQYIVPIPLHPKRLFNRAYNQSELIAKELSKLTQIPLITNLVLRNKNTKSQGGLSQKERMKNITNAFILNEKISADFKHTNLLLVDDVITTSSTIESCAKTLSKLEGKIYVAAWAKRILDQ